MGTIFPYSLLTTGKVEGLGFGIGGLGDWGVRRFASAFVVVCKGSGSPKLDFAKTATMSLFGSYTVQQGS